MCECMCVCFCVCACERERERDRQRERNREKETERTSLKERGRWREGGRERACVRVPAFSRTSSAPSIVYYCVGCHSVSPACRRYAYVSFCLFSFFYHRHRLRRHHHPHRRHRRPVHCIKVRQEGHICVHMSSDCFLPHIN